MPIQYILDVMKKPFYITDHYGTRWNNLRILRETIQMIQCLFDKDNVFIIMLMTDSDARISVSSIFEVWEFEDGTNVCNGGMRLCIDYYPQQNKVINKKSILFL